MIGLLQSGTGIGSGICLPITSSGLLVRCLATRDPRAAREVVAPARTTVPAPALALPPAEPPARCRRWLGARVERGAAECGRSPASPVIWWTAAADAGEDDGVVAGRDAGVAAEPPGSLGFDSGGSLGEAPAPPPVGLVGVPAPGVSVGPVPGALGVDTLTSGVDKLTLGVDTLTPGTDTLTLGTDTLTSGTDMLTPGSDTPTLGNATPTLGNGIAGNANEPLAWASASPVSSDAPIPMSIAPSATPARQDRPGTIVSHRVPFEGGCSRASLG
jgi:hypothetical protein